MTSMLVNVSSVQYSLRTTNNFNFFKCDQEIYIFEATRKSIQDLWEMFIVQHVQTKIVLTCHPTKLLVFTTVKSGKPALTSLIFHSQIKNRQYFYLAEKVENIPQGKRVATTKKNNYLDF